jgi:arylformamidase
MRMGRVLDLSHRMIPGKEEYGLALETHFTDELLSGYQRDEGVWYILQDIRMSSHCGTHIEFPYHHSKNGLDAGSFPLERLIGECLLLDFTHKKPDEAVTLEELKERERKIFEGDMLLFNFDCSRLYYTEHAHSRPYIAPEAVQWLVLEKKISLIGSDASGIEVKGIPNQPNHQFLMDHGVPVIEFAANLDQLRKERFTLFALALCIVGLDSCPVRLIAIEDED